MVTMVVKKMEREKNDNEIKWKITVFSVSVNIRAFLFFLLKPDIYLICIVTRLPVRNMPYHSK